MWGTKAAQAGLVRKDNPYRDPSARAAWLLAYDRTRSALHSVQDRRTGTRSDMQREAPQEEHGQLSDGCLQGA